MRAKPRFIVPLFVLLLLATLLTPAIAWAGGGFYPVDANIKNGMLVSLTKNPEVVEAATDKNMSTLVGVVGTAPTDYDVKSGQISVQTDGKVETLVSTINGDINVGDHISPSTLVGIGAKSNGRSMIIGVAQLSLSASTAGVAKTSIADSAGGKHEVYLATIPVQVRVTQENLPDQASGEQSSILPNKVQTFANSVAGKKASQVALIFSMIILLAGFVISGIIAYTAVAQAMKATSRQPLAKQAIVKRMVQSITVALIILSAAIASALIIIRIL